MDNIHNESGSLLDDMGGDLDDKPIVSTSPSSGPSITSKLVLTFCCVAYVFSSIGTDAIRVLQLDFEKVFSHTQMGVIYASYAFSATLLVLLVGPAIDRWGVGVCTLVCALMGAVGFLLQVLGSFLDSFILIVLGRFLHGGGAEALFVCWDNHISLWFFASSNSTLAMSLYCAAGRFGDLLVTGALPNMGDRATKMLVALGSVVMATGANIVLVVIDKKQRHLLAHQNETVERQPFVASVRAFPLGYWLCLAVSVILYGLIGQQLQFVPTIIGNLFLNPIVPSMLPCITIIMAVVLTPVFGWLLTQKTKFLAILIACVCLLFSCLSLFLSYSTFILVFGLILLGLCYALTSAGIWGTISCYGNSTNFGLLYSVPYAFFNLFNFAASVVSGAMIDYLPVIACLIFWSVTAFAGLIIGVAWLRLNK